MSLSYLEFKSVLSGSGHILDEIQRPSKNFEVHLMVSDSRTVSKDAVFFACKGNNFDGHDYLEEVIRKKPSILVVENLDFVPVSFLGPIFKVKNSQNAFASGLRALNEYPDKNLFCIGVTGTNGKTTTTCLIESIFENCGIGMARMGTLGHFYRKNKWDTQLTTPGPLEFFNRLNEIFKLGAKGVTFEASSHAIDQDRFFGVDLDLAIFTNLTQDHLDYHKNFESYFEAKKKLFSEYLYNSKKQKKYAVINVDDSWGEKLISSLSENSFEILSFGMNNGEFRFKILSRSLQGTKFKVIWKDGHFSMFDCPLIGDYNVYNLMGSILSAFSFGIEEDKIVSSVSNISQIRGRLEKVPNDKGLNIFVDFAHTDDGIQKVLSTLGQIRNSMSDQPKLRIVFGCGGDRDKDKRPRMFRAACQGADFIYVTSDNPRTEDPRKIISEIIGSNQIGDRVFVEVDRRKAIQLALKDCNEGDILVIAGKGHETYQIIGTKKYDFDDVKVVKELLIESQN